MTSLKSIYYLNYYLNITITVLLYLQIQKYYNNCFYYSLYAYYSIQIRILNISRMNQLPTKHKPIDESSLKAKLTYSQIKVQQSFKQPVKYLTSILTAFTYIQCLKYPIDCYSGLWFGETKLIFSYLDLSYFMRSSTPLVCSVLGLLYFLLSFLLVLFEKRKIKHIVYASANLLQLAFSSVLFMLIIGNTCDTIKQYISSSNKNQQILISVTFSILSSILFSFVICLQTYIRFDFISVSSMSGVIRKSNWSGVALLLYIVINQLSSKLASQESSIHQIVMSISQSLLLFIILAKSQHQQSLPLRIQLSLLSVNTATIILLLCRTVLKQSLTLDIIFIISIMVIFAISQIQLFNLSFQLENVNKWSNSQIIISYAAKLRKVLLRSKGGNLSGNENNYYYYTLFLGYIEIHQQKCDNQMCPLRNTDTDESNRRTKFEEIIKIIYNDGYKLSPINPQLLLEYAIFYYEIGSKQKSMKTLLQIKYQQLSLDKYYKFSRLKNLIHRQVSQMPNQQFLDLLSEIKVKDLQEKIFKKFQQAALITLQFWSILNEDHPDFRKLHQVGKSRVLISEQVHSLYKQITQIAYSQRITSLYIHYLTQIQNQQKLYSQLQKQIRNQQNFESKIVIQDWANNCNSIMIISVEQQNYGVIIDLNTTCATMLGSERFDILGRDLRAIFPGVLGCQINSFIDVKAIKNQGDQFYYIGYSSGYTMKVTRKIQSYNSLETGLSLIITIQQKFISNVGFMIFNEETRLATMSSSCLQLLNLEENILESQILFDQLFHIQLSEINDQKTIIKFENLLKSDNVNKFCSDPEFQAKEMQRLFNVYKKICQNYFVINFNLLKAVKYSSKLDQSSKFKPQIYEQQTNEFKFQLLSDNGYLTYLGSSSSLPRYMQKQIQFSYQKQQTKQSYKIRNYGQNITTLRLHENYIKVIQDEQDNDQQQGENQSQNSTNNQFLLKVNKLSKGDQEKIFQSKESYEQFIDKHIKKIYLRTGLAVSVLISLGIYIGIYLVIRNGYSQIFQSHHKLVLQNQIIGQISQTNRLLLMTKYRKVTKSAQADIDYLLIESYNMHLNRLQGLITQYNNPYMLQVYINQQKTQLFRSDQFILAYISQLSKIVSRVNNATNLNDLQLNANTSLYIQINGNLTKNKMIPEADNLKNNANKISAKTLDYIKYFNVGGFISAIIMTVFLFIAMKRVNQYKVSILSVFLETTQKDIQIFSQKTQNFLITLHVDQSNESTQIAQQLIQAKKNASLTFTKKKKFKTTQFSKNSYIVIGLFFFFAIGYYVHSFSHSIQKDLFLVDSIQYINIASKYGDLFSTEQAKIDRKLLDSYGLNFTVIDQALVSEINTKLLNYEREYFTWHYKTYGILDQYHQKFAKIFMQDICDGQIKVKHACQAGIMSSNGTLLMLTDITVQNQQLSFESVPEASYYLTMQTIRNAHSILLSYIMEVNQQFFQTFAANTLLIIILWSIVVILVGILVGVYVQKVIVKDMIIIKSMLKFLPVSFAKNSLGVNSLIGTIIEQMGV